MTDSNGLQAGTDPIFRFLTLILLVAFVVHRAYATRKGQRRADEVVREAPSNNMSRIAAIVFVVALLTTAFYILVPRYVGFAEMPLPLWMRWLGMLVAGTGFALLQWAQNTLGRNWSDTPRLLADQQLVTEGPYRWIRHPIYSGFLLILGATLLISANWLVGGAWIIATLLAVWARIQFEEALMAETFGVSYADWAAHTGALLPRLG